MKIMIVKDEIVLSVIIPVYNVEKYLKECLDSIFVHQQINDQIEVIVVNDGSTDGSLCILEEYKKNHDFILITQKSSGPGGARNTGIKSAQGRYLLFIDSDDFIVPGALGKLLIYLSTSKTDIIEFDYKVFNDTDRVYNPRINCPSVTSGSGQEVFCSWIKSGFYNEVIWTRAVSRELIISNHLFFYPEIYHQDVEWSPKVFAYAKSVCYFQHVLYVYRIRDGSITSTKTQKHYYDLLKVIDSLYVFSCNTGFSARYISALRCELSFLYFSIIKGIKLTGKYDEKLVSMLNKNKELLNFSEKRHRKYLYKWIIDKFGIKTFYIYKYGLRDLLKKYK